MAGFSPAIVQQNTYFKYDNFYYLFLQILDLNVVIIR